MIPIPSVPPDASWPLWYRRLKSAGHDTVDLLSRPLFVCAVRGLFSNSIGKSGNDVNAYDDGFAVIIPTQGEPTVITFNGNTDPARYGWNPDAGEFMARLKPGRWQMQKRMHRGKYWAFGQEDFPVTVERIRADGTVAKTETGQFGIDLHPGGDNSTSSEGCQTVPRDQWDHLFHAIAGRAGTHPFPYILMDAATLQA